MRAIAIASTCALVIASGVACGGSTDGAHNNNSGGQCNPCDDAGSSGIASPSSGHDVNPDGVAYPKLAIGKNARSGTSTKPIPGNVIQNFKFLGYPNADPSKGLQTISLADYYDPCQKRAKMLHITVAGVWCTYCNAETSDIVADKAQLDSERIIILQALDDGLAVGVPATQANLNYWVSVHRPTFTEVLDPGLHNLGGFFQASAIPWNADIDVRTMEILTSSVGEENPATDFQAPLALTSEAPLYPLAVTCQ
jgi:hypothetical protein